jgi:hypothetical protein
MTSILLSSPTRPITISLLCVNHTLLDKWVRYWQFTYQPYIYPDDTSERRNPDNHRSVLYSVGLSTKEEELDLPPLYWIHKLLQCPYKQVILLGLPNGSRNLLPNYQHTIYILSVIKTGLQNYCDTSYTGSGVNQMCILKNSKDLLEYMQSRSLSCCNTINTFDYSNLYTTIPHSKWMLVQLCFIKKEYPT